MLGTLLFISAFPIQTIQNDSVVYKWFTFHSYIEVDQKLFQAVNQYRLHYGKDTLQWNDCAYKSSTHHSKYMAISWEVSSDEPVKVDGIERIKKLNARVKKFIGYPQQVSEIINGGSAEILGSDTAFASFVKDVFSKQMKDISAVDKVIYHLIFNWHTSPSERELLLDSKFNAGAVSLFYSPPEVYSDEQELFFQEQEIYCTLDLVEY